MVKESLPRETGGNSNIGKCITTAHLAQVRGAMPGLNRWAELGHKPSDQAHDEEQHDGAKRSDDDRTEDAAHNGEADTERRE
jgi:hypothetical protein